MGGLFRSVAYVSLGKRFLYELLTDELIMNPKKLKFFSLKKFDKVVAKEPKRARGTKGRYKADDKSTADINEAWVGGKAPKRKTSKKPAAKKTKVTSIKKKKWF